VFHVMKKILDASFLVSAVRSCDVHHRSCYGYLKDHEPNTWIVPSIAYFEYQATQSRLRQEGKGAYRELYIPNWEVYDISLTLIRQVAALDLPNLFAKLRGADLIYGCIAKIECLPLVSCDRHFAAYQREIQVINPLMPT
jgi:predicted nucleic acid-binding protein